MADWQNTLSRLAGESSSTTKSTSGSYTPSYYSDDLSFWQKLSRFAETASDPRIAENPNAEGITGYLGEFGKAAARTSIMFASFVPALALDAGYGLSSLVNGIGGLAGLHPNLDDKLFGEGYQPFVNNFLAVKANKDPAKQGFQERLGNTVDWAWNGTISGVGQDLETVKRLENKYNMPLASLGSFYAKRYGSWEGFTDALYHDTPGVFADLAMLVGMGEAAATKLGRIGEISEISRLSAAGEAAKAAEAAGDLSNLGRQIKYLRDSRTLASAAEAGVDIPKTLRYASEAAAGVEVRVGRLARAIDKFTRRDYLVYGTGKMADGTRGTGAYIRGSLKNPFSRAVEGIWKRFTLDDFATLKTQYEGELLAAQEAGDAIGARQALIRMKALDDVKAQGATLIEKPWFQNRKRAGLVDHFVGGQKRFFYSQRNIAFAELEDALSLMGEQALTNGEAADALVGARFRSLDVVPEADLEEAVISAGFKNLEEASAAAVLHGRSSISPIPPEVETAARDAGFTDPAQAVAVAARAMAGDPVLAQRWKLEPSVGLLNLRAADARFAGFDLEQVPLLLDQAVKSWPGDARLSSLSPTELASLRTLSLDGDLPSFDPLTYQPSPELKALPARVALEDAVFKATGSAQISESEAAFKMAMIDEIGNGPVAEFYRRQGIAFDIEDYYRGIKVAYKKKFKPLSPEEQYSMLTGQFDIEHLAKVVVGYLKDDPDSMLMFEWYQSMQELAELFAGKTKTLRNGQQRDSFNLFIDLLAVTSPGQSPFDQLNPRSPYVLELLAQAETLDLSPGAEWLSRDGKFQLIQGKSGEAYQLVREIFWGWTPDKWDLEGFRNSMLAAEAELARAASPATKAKAQARIDALLSEMGRFGYSIEDLKNGIPPVEVIESRVEHLLRKRRNMLASEIKNGKLIRGTKKRVPLTEEEIAARNAEIELLAEQIRKGEIPEEVAKEMGLLADKRMKVRNYHANLMGNYDRVTIDRRIGVALGLAEDAKIEAKYGKAALTKVRAAMKKGEATLLGALKPQTYRDLDNLIVEITNEVNRTLRRLRDPALPQHAYPASVQAVIWGRFVDFMDEVHRELRAWVNETTAKTFVVKGTGKKLPRAAIERHLELMELSRAAQTTERYIDIINELLTSETAQVYADQFAEGAVRMFANAEKMKRDVVGQIVGSFLHGKDGERFIRYFTGAGDNVPAHEMGHFLESILRDFDPARHRLLGLAAKGVTSDAMTMVGGRSIVDEIFQRGGATIDVVTDVRIPKGYSVGRGGKGISSITGEEINMTLELNPGEFTEEAVENFIAHRSRYLVDETNPHRGLLGAWRSDDGKMWLDVSDVVDTLDEAMDLGGKRDQWGVYDILERKFIETGGTGAKPATAADAANASQRAAALAEAVQRNVDGGDPTLGSGLGEADRLIGAADGGLEPVTTDGPATKWSDDQSEWFANQLEAARAGGDVHPLVQDLVRDYMPESRRFLPGAMRDNRALFGGMPRRSRVINIPKPIEFGDIWNLRHGIEDNAELLASAPRASLEMRKQLAQLVGTPFIKSRIKTASAAYEASSELAKVRDLIGHRVILPDWGSIDAFLSDLAQETDLIPVAIQDLRPGKYLDERGNIIMSAEEWGLRGVKVYVESPKHPGILGEIELGTELFDYTREASTQAGKHLRRSRDMAVGIKRALEEGQQGVLPEHLDAAIRSNELAARRLQGIWEAVTDEIDFDLNGHALPGDEFRAGYDRTRLWVARNLEEPEIASGWGDPAYMFERQYLAARLESGAKWTGDLYDGTFVGGKSALELDDMFRNEGRPQPIYFPDTDARRMTLRDFLSGRKSGSGQGAITRPGYVRRNRGIIRSNVGNLEEGPVLSNDVRRVYQRRATAALRRIDEAKFVETITSTFGRRIKGVEELMPGEAPFMPGNYLKVVSMMIEFDDLLAEAIRRGEHAGLSRGELDFISRDSMPKVIREGLDSIMSGDNVEQKAALETLASLVESSKRRVPVAMKNQEIWAIPKVVYDRLNDSVARSGVLGRLLWDAPTRGWRRMVLAGSPRWILNNTLGNTTFLKLQGGRFTDVFRYMISSGFRDAVDAIAAEGVTGGLYAEGKMLERNLGVASRTKLGRAYEAVGGSLPFRGVGKALDWMTRTNEFVEDAFRSASYLKAVDKQLVAAGMRKTSKLFWTSIKRLEDLAISGIDEVHARNALEDVNYFFNDYTRSTPFEAKVIRRVVAPFWGFYRHVAMLAITYPFKYPVRANILRAISQMEEDYAQDNGGPIPSWLENAVPLGLNPDGSRKYYNTKGPDPMSGLKESPISLAHPFIKSLWEWSTGRNSYTGREFTDENVARDFVTGMRWYVTRDDNGNIVSVEPVDKIRPSIPEMVLQQFPQYNLVKDFVAGGSTYDTASLLDILQGRGVVVDPKTGKPYTTYDPLQVLLKFLGFSTYNYDIDKYQNETYPDALQRAMTSYRNRMGEG